ncbi:TPA: rod shape-determining protein RodA [Patescibacteria group bacterium]|nr:MAG: Rod shape-determining protein [Parcubacteria group bacterium GW2011_GWF2_40_10]KKR48018.1 MAG: Rod shape-determining protein [Parcubacteria group bacterium GW2011_GWA2_40_143]KKR60498.1 MAG: Rod shape-determining protein [Parcubacteria group bacterium GW2011_GWC2_40_31]KKR76145.1 MAG: Rod shape-determining protein [Parcubacteria group bacterium GW2011_GWE2_40_8]KKR82366.1 MAG: Rod shape-determining protein [Parcubacteria group bacterium GW2011_GWD2_40_9]HBB56959.1 rod shape-determining
MRAIYKNASIDWVLFIATLPLLAAGLISMRSFGLESDYYFTRQVYWIIFSMFLFFSFSFVDWRIFKKTEVLVVLFLVANFFLMILLVTGKVTKGAASWFDLGLFSIEPVDPLKILIIFILAKYFSRRHIEIANIRHIIIPGLYVGIPTFLVFLQPDFGSAIILFLIWLAMIMVAGISKRHLIAIVLILTTLLSISWFFAFEPYQKDRILTFLNPARDARGAGYNALQSTIAVGSGGMFGKGIGFGSQSRLEFLPEHQTDFIFAAFVEEWGFVGAMFVFIFYAIVVWRVLKNAYLGQSNFETLFGIGVASFLAAHFFVHIGMNIGLLPITGTTLPFLSYGGSHMATVYMSLGILMGMRRYSRHARSEEIEAEYLESKFD